MFTGIVEELGIVKALDKQGKDARISVESKVCISDSRIGDSISVNGVCLTLIDRKEKILSFDISSETLKRTDIGLLRQGDCVNLERSLKSDSRLGGHFVSGHIDGTGRIAKKRVYGKFIEIEIEIPQSLMGYVVEKGSIAIDGISLTVNKVADSRISLSLIPHTISATTLGKKDIGNSVNIETDILAKYTERLISRPVKQGSSSHTSITQNLLKEHGFI